jgi:hypothetical protein
MKDPGPVKARLLSRLRDLAFPVLGSYWYGHDWHAPRAVGRVHHGCDIFAKKGTPLVAVSDGTVSNLLTLGLGGISLRLTTDDGDYFYYAHMTSYAPGLQEGDAVRRGDVLGYVGNTGNARTTPPHCHFEVHPGGGDPVDPYPYLEQWRGGKTAVVPPPAAGRGEADDGSGQAIVRRRQRQPDRRQPVPVPRTVNAGIAPPAEDGAALFAQAALSCVAAAATGAVVVRRRTRPPFTEL